MPVLNGVLHNRAKIEVVLFDTKI